jgi:hypothetical protein
MPVNRLFRSGARAVRDVVTRAHLRADLLPRLPFVVPIVIASVLLVVAVEHDPETDAATVTVDELPSGPPTFYEGEYPQDGEEEVALEILEYGFSKVVAADGRERIIAALVVRNPYDADLLPGTMSIRTETEGGYPVPIEDVYVGMLPPESTAKLGYVLYSDAEDIDPDELKLVETSPSMLYSDIDLEAGAEERYVPDPFPEVEFTGLEPLTSPDGYRVHYRTETAASLNNAMISVLFRDGEGRLLGGLPTAGDPMSEENQGVYRLLPEGEATHHFDMHEAWIPEGADLDQIEIGPSQ